MEFALCTTGENGYRVIAWFATKAEAESEKARLQGGYNALYVCPRVYFD